MSSSITVVWDDADNPAVVSITDGTGNASTAFTVNGSAVTFPHSISATTKFVTTAADTYELSVLIDGQESVDNPDAVKVVPLSGNDGVVVRPSLDTNFRRSVTHALAASRGTALGNRFAFFGDSNTSGTNNGGEDYSDYATVLSGSRLRNRGKLGYPGYRTDMLLDKVSDVVASGANSCFVLAGTNDAGADATVTTYISRITALVSALRAESISVVLGTVPPRVDKALLVSQYNAALASYCTANNVPLVDVHKQLVDTATGGLQSAYDTGDGIHFNGAGHYLVGTEISTRVSPLTPYSEPWLATSVADTTNLLTNPLFLTDSNSDGQADNWTRTGAATPTQTIVTDSRFVGKAQKFAFSSNSSFRSYAQTISTGFSVGDRLGMGFAYAIENLAGVAVGNGFKFQYTWVGPGTLTIPISGQVNAVNRGVWWAEDTVPVGATGIKYEFVVSAGATGVANFLIAQATLRNLTALGIS